MGAAPSHPPYHLLFLQCTERVRYTCQVERPQCGGPLRQYQISVLLADGAKEPLSKHLQAGLRRGTPDVHQPTSARYGELPHLLTQSHSFIYSRTIITIYMSELREVRIIAFVIRENHVIFSSLIGVASLSPASWVAPKINSIDCQRDTFS